MKLFDDKLTAQDEFKFDGTKGGDRWKGKLERYYMSKSPAMKNILEWSERCETGLAEGLTEDMVSEAIGNGMTGTEREFMNASLWGFLSNCVSGDTAPSFIA